MPYSTPDSTIGWQVKQDSGQLYTGIGQYVVGYTWAGSTYSMVMLRLRRISPAKVTLYCVM